MRAAGLLLLALLPLAAAPAGAEPPGDGREVPTEPGFFRPDPAHELRPYDPAGQLEIYGGKRAVRAARPLIELGRPLYREGPLGRAWHLLAYGDLRTAVAYNDDGGGREGAAWASRLNLDVDMKLAATERVHLFFQPLDRDGLFTRCDFGRSEDRCVGVGDLDPRTVYYEGDAARLWASAARRENALDLPFAAGLLPLVVQNGVWLEDAFTGAALTLPARNSRLLDVSNADLTVFAGFDKVTTRAAAAGAGGRADDHAADVFGAFGFAEAGQGYWELGYGYTDFRGRLQDLDYHNLAAAFTRRYGGLLSNSLRVVWNVGQKGRRESRTADGLAVILENSWITRRPLVWVPYLNLFAGFEKPQSLARDAGAGGLLKNTGMLFETDGLTGFPKLDDSAQDVYGGALGVEHLFELDRQLALEAALVSPRERRRGGQPLRDTQAGFSARYQVPVTRRLILRADAMYALRRQDDDLHGARLEARLKF